MGWPMPNLVGIHPAVWAPNLNKHTDKQTDRQTSFIHIDTGGGHLGEYRGRQLGEYAFSDNLVIFLTGQSIG